MKKIISILLSVLMVLTVMPMTVFAADEVAQVGTTSTAPKYATLQEAIDAAVETGANATVKLLANVTEDIVIPNTNGKKITLNTNSKTITGVADHTITVSDGAIVAIENTGSIISTVNGKAALYNSFYGTVTVGTSSYATKLSRTAGEYYVIENKGKMTITKANVTNTATQGASALITNGWINNSEAIDDVTLTINDGTFTGKKIVVKNDAKGILNINGGTFTSELASFAVQNWNIATISKGTFNNKVYTFNGLDDTSIGKLTVTGGTFNSEIADYKYKDTPGELTISGGTFATKPADEYVVDGAWYYTTTTGKSVLTTATPTVEINGNKYPSMSVALTQNNYEGEYTLIADSASFVLPASTDKGAKTIVLNLNGYTVKETGTGSAIKVNGTGADVTINGPGNVYAGKNSSTAATVVASAVWVTKQANVTINGGNYYAYTTTAGKANPVVYNDAIGATITINDGNFIGTDATTKDALLKVRPTYAGKANYVLNGGTYSADPSIMDDVAIAENLESVDNGDGTFTVQAALDFTAFDAVIVTANAVDELAYTEASVTALKTKVASYDKAALTTQDAINAAVEDIQTAINNLEKKEFTVKTYIVNGDSSAVKISDNTCEYGDEYVAYIPNEYENYNVTKWTVEKTDGTATVATNEKALSLVVNDNMDIVVYVSEKPVDVDQARTYRKYSFLSKGGAVVAIQYAYVDEEDSMAMPEAPAIPFYEFDYWQRVDERTFVAVYDVNDICQIIAGDNILVNGVAGTNVDYDDLVKVTKKAAGKVALSRDAAGTDIITYLNDETEFHCPMVKTLYVILVQDAEASVGVTGTYAEGDVRGVNVQFYLPADATLVETGVVFTADNGKTLKLASTKQTDNNEFTIELVGAFVYNYTFTATAFLTYKDAQGNLKTVESSTVAVADNK